MESAYNGSENFGEGAAQDGRRGDLDDDAAIGDVLNRWDEGDGVAHIVPPASKSRRKETKRTKRRRGSKSVTTQSFQRVTSKSKSWRAKESKSRTMSMKRKEKRNPISRLRNK